MNITVYLGANEGNDLSLRKAVQELGTWIGASGNALVYGGSKTGLMGAPESYQVHVWDNDASTDAQMPFEIRVEWGK